MPKSYTLRNIHGNNKPRVLNKRISISLGGVCNYRNNHLAPYLCFYIMFQGGATVHLTGHLAPDDGPDEMDGMMDGSSMFESGSEGEEEEEEASDSGMITH